MRETQSVLLAFLVAIGSGFAQAAPVAELVAADCKSDIETLCKDVTQGQGRLAACLYAYSDRISGRCIYAMYNVMDQLELVASRIRYVANVCMDDIESLCVDTSPGGGRILDCLGQNEAKVSAACNQALNDTGARTVADFVKSQSNLRIVICWSRM